VKGDFPALSDLAEDGAALARLVARNAFLPHPDVVAQIQGAVWPCIRANRALGTRGTLAALPDGPVLLDDNTVPRWALLVAHGFGPNLPHNGRGWAFAHVWPEPRCPHSYTALANLAMIAEPLAGLTDKTGPVAPFLRYHALARYGWAPPNKSGVQMPEGFAEIEWRYFQPVSDPKARLEGFLAKSGNAWAKQLAGIV